MSAALAHNLMRRGAEATLYNEKLQLPTWGIVLFGFTAAIYLIVSGVIEYTLGRIVPTLLMIESPPESIVFEPLATDDTDVTLNKNTNTNTEAQAVKPKPITASFRATLRLLSQKGGFRALVSVMAVSWIAQIVSLAPFVPRSVVAVVASVLCAQLSVAWTHIVISEPSPKMWFRRLPSTKTWRKVAAPTAVLAIAEQVTVLIPVSLGMMSGIGAKLQTPDQMANIDSRQAWIITLTGVGIGALALVLGFLLVVPADVALTRVQASLLTDSDETIVPFDRSFNGKVIPEIVGGTGAIGMLDAWKSFDWAARVRLVKAYFKVFLMQLAIAAVFVVVAVLEVALVLGKSKKVADGEPDSMGLDLM
ncbi:hypothetical protein LAWI1_G002665 [Lachnellula willkommii]|uniref:Uncharacterized protein n=1 Tax=Lachnellula willkommii TaxID=215461 RepID=A0A559MGA9_9HELO|nr:hypothetical protein LAWI1_G002665 [Lachnellula willkommii]